MYKKKKIRYTIDKAYLEEIGRIKRRRDIK